MTFREYIRSYIEDFKAWRRGERRVAPRGSRGRVYASRAKGTVKVEMKITRADGSVEFREAPGKLTNIQ